jgi:DNA invertase Pin-like site-specific DNA recombinase
MYGNTQEAKLKSVGKIKRYRGKVKRFKAKSKSIRAKCNCIALGYYLDEGISATNTKRRDGFNRMVTDALDGKIDLIVTKSVSRFARNTVDSLTTVRKLKEKGVEVYFQKENIYTLDSKGELLITIMSSLAQEESRSISENVTWGQRKRFADGKVTMPYRHFLGYCKGADGLPEIVPEEANLVRRIYKLFMQGKTPHGIAKILTCENIPTPARKTVWQSSTVKSILRNEKYRGDARLQKKFTVDFLQKKMKVNEGEVPQYYVENSHPAIINPDEWDLVQAEFSRRKELGQRYSSTSVFASKLICGDCGTPYGAKEWHSTDKYRRTVWQCNNKFKGKEKCSTPHLYEQDIKALFLRALGKLMTDCTYIIDDCRLAQATLCDCSTIDTQKDALAEEMSVVAELIRQCVDENSTKMQSQAEYLERYERHTGRYDKLKKQYEALDVEHRRRKEQSDRLEAFINTLEKQKEPPITFDDELWIATVEHATVYSDERVVFTFKSGIEITEQM